MFAFKDAPIRVAAGDKVRYTDAHIFASYRYEETSVTFASDGSIVARPLSKDFTLRTSRHVPRLGVMVVGLGGNNGSTLAAGKLGYFAFGQVAKFAPVLLWVAPVDGLGGGVWPRGPCSTNSHTINIPRPRPRPRPTKLSWLTRRR